MTLALALTLMACTPDDKASTSEQTFFTPQAGVICDRTGGFCANSKGIDMTLSKDYLGETAAYSNFLERQAGKIPDVVQLDPVSFAFSDLTHCDIVEKWCSNVESGAYNEKVTTELFGSQ